ncbi:MAG: hypothetical protein ABIH69_02170 [bacterium]
MAHEIAGQSAWQVARIFTARIITPFNVSPMHGRLSSMLLARIYQVDEEKAVGIAKEIVKSLGVSIANAKFLTNKGWVDLGVEILAVGRPWITEVKISSKDFVPGYCVDASGRLILLGCSAPQVNAGHLIKLKIDPNHSFMK